MKRRTLDIIFSVGGLGLAALLVIIGLVLTANANFAKDYVRDQLSEQKITFTPAEFLSEEERQAECLVANAGQPVTTGKQAECYANEYIGLHLKDIAEGQTYAELGGVQRGLEAQIEEAPEGEQAALEAELAEVTGARDTLFKGETLRGLLLTSYGFSVFGVKGAQVATIAFALAGLLAVLALAGLVHAMRTPPTVVVGNGHSVRTKEMASV
ncbi:MAG TPA: hypothetical protein VM618_13245 [Acidimicrobiia bacterium]|nr:hypothetical protein [Acidimicrobiia bacterium]